MQIALLGGTGDIGEGLALRFAYDTDHDVLIGSREASRAETKAREYETELDSRGRTVDVAGHDNAAAAAAADVVVLAVPAYHLSDTVEAIEDAIDEDTVLVTPAVGMKRDEDGFHYNRPGAGSVTALAAEAAPEDVPVVGAYHNLPAARLANLDADLGIDTAIVGDDADAVDTVTRLTEAIEGLRPVDAGPLANAAEIEAITPLLINVAKNNDGMHDLGVRFE
ncbi:NADPH-dependent F420 reductase [Halorientalis regularis]|jgi:NADPH-dependent F420 reductase|uniref:Reduced coenzyme F420:NADP oxidoreductase n=1 Tax=Halorientalis regularis TaxID=660518 RepID=A0A1G7PYY9_9EURY|nr:NADPH-dependent F420 reductase [Halorientalis regularis]SDF91537.1 reduced coenzyme F420:NADP oxidoreductase [Halorientalis regularis]